MNKIKTLLLLVVLALGIRAECWADPLRIVLRNGSIITIEPTDQPVKWTTVLPDGTLHQQTFPLSQIRRLEIASTSSSKRVAEVRHLLTLLESSKYAEREKAELRLADAKIGGGFRNLIEKYRHHPKLEVRHRVARILKQLDDSKASSNLVLDRLVLKSGQRLEGEATRLDVSGKYQGEPVAFQRTAIRMLMRPGDVLRSHPPVEGDPVQVKIFHQWKKHFFQPGQRKVDFEQDPHGNLLKQGTDVSETFVPWGLRIGIDKKGYPGISGYRFKYAGLPPRNNSVCVYETVGSHFRRFKGEIDFRFCVPGEPTAAGGVHEFGLFVARIDHARDFVVEAYNSSGQRLATVESANERCAFFGVKSTEPIAMVRVRSNQWLASHLKRKIDEDFAIDSVCFSPPLLLPDASDRSQWIALHNQDILFWKSLESQADQLIVQTDAVKKPISIPKSEVGVIQLGSQPTVRDAQDRQPMVMLEDRSVLKIEPGLRMVSPWFPELVWKEQQLTSLWAAGNGARFPVDGDFSQGESVLVFPSCRVVANDVKFNPPGVTWKPVARLEQELGMDPEQGARESKALPPFGTTVDFSKSSLDEIPTFWLAPPKAPAAGRGLIRFTDGQQLVLGETFRLESLDTSSVTISGGGQKKTIPASQVLSIRFPKPVSNR